MKACKATCRTVHRKLENFLMLLQISSSHFMRRVSYQPNCEGYVLDANTNMVRGIGRGVRGVSTEPPSRKDHLVNKTLGRVRDPHANGAWLSKLTE